MKRNWWQQFLTGEGGYSRINEGMLWALLFVLTAPVIYYLILVSL